MMNIKWHVGVGGSALLLVMAVMASLSVGQTDDDTTTQSFRGMVLPGKQVLLQAPVDGRVASTPVEEGQTVKAGALLLQMDDQVQQAVVKAAKLRANATAEVERAQLELEEAKVTLERLIEAQKQRAAREWEVRRARLRRDIAEVVVKAAAEARRIAESQVALETERLAQMRLVAPWDGVVTALPAEVGSTLTRNDPALKLVSLTKLKAEIYLPAGWHDKVQVGESYALNASAPVNGNIIAKLAFADPVIDPGSQSFRCVFVIDNADQKLPAGFAVTLDLDNE